jgi:galactonate dehydratase
MVSESPEGQPAPARVREYASDRGLRLAGAERQVAAQGFQRYADNKLLDVVIPDIKYAGGYGESVKKHSWRTLAPEMIRDPRLG